MLPNFRKSDGEASLVGFMTPPGAPQSPAPQSNSTTRPIGSPLRTAERGIPSVIGPELKVTGNLVSHGEIQVEGEINGDIHGSHVLVGERAQVTGGIVGEEVVVRGHVMGSVRGKRVLLQSTSRVEGDVYHVTLAIEQGAYFEGKSRRTEDPTAGFGFPDRAPGDIAARPAAETPPVIPVGADGDPETATPPITLSSEPA
jgi:cytoskeletal protein CcmA (bactofilin family)